MNLDIDCAHKMTCYEDKTKDVIFGHAVFVCNVDGDEIADVVFSPEFEVLNIWRN